MTDPLQFRYRTRLTKLHGERAIIVETEIPDNAPADLKEGLARRATRAGMAIEVTVQHEPDRLALLPGYLPVDLGPEVAS